MCGYIIFQDYYVYYGFSLLFLKTSMRRKHKIDELQEY